MSIIIEVGNTTSRIIGNLPTEKIEPLRYQLSYKEPGHFFRKQANRFAQERKYLITEKRQEFRTGLLSRVLTTLDTLETEYEVKDNRLTADQDHFMPLKLEATMRTYQEDAIRIAIAEKTGMVRVATGGGKTRIMAGIVAALERRAVIVVHRLDLLHQVLDVLSELMLYREVIGIVGGGTYEPNLVTVVTVQTICAALGINYEAGDDDDDEKPRGASAHRDEIEAMLSQAQVVVVDEAHHAPARTISEVLKRCPNATWRIGMSATDWRDDGADLLIEAAIGPRIFDISLSDLMDMGYLVPASIRMVPMAVEGYIEPSDAWNALYKQFYTDNVAFHEQAVTWNMEQLQAGRHILTLVTSIKHGQRLQALHQDWGLESVFLSGKDPTSKRQEVLNDVRSGRLRCLIGTSIADEGLDLPILDALNLAGGGKSTTRAYQRIGRTLRPMPGKERSQVIDYRCRGSDKLRDQAGKRAGVYKRERGFDFREEKI